MRKLIVVFIALVVLVLVFFVARSATPVVELPPALVSLGQATPITVHVRDPRGIRRVQVFVEQNGARHPVFEMIRVIFLIPISIILTWLYNRSSRSIQATVIFHASMNTFPFVLPYFAPGLTLLFIIAAYAVIADRMWRSKYASAKHPTAVTTAVS